jgi:peptidoglycan hydrolase-like protein with peptidoglycan-binding domain
MKKYTLSLSIFTLILLGLLSFGANSANAYDYSYGCTTAGPFNTITGQLCSGAQSQYGSSGYSNTFSNQQFALGARGPEVVALQQMLASAGFYFGRIDGVYGPVTDTAYQNYQAQYSNNYSYPYTNPSSYINPNIYPYYNQAPSISAVNGPQTLSVNQMGTWTITVPNLSSGNLTYSVNWGDQPVYAYGVNNSVIYPPQQNATFTHAYLQAGTYSPMFTVTNSIGQKASTSLTVTVSGVGSTSYTAPFISSISPSSGRVGTQVVIYGRGFNSNIVCIAYPCNNYSSNTINFGLSIIPNAYSADGTSLTFTIPAYTNSACQYSTPACVIPQYQILPGTYPVFVTNSNGISNVMNFSVTY